MRNAVDAVLSWRNEDRRCGEEWVGDGYGIVQLSRRGEAYRRPNTTSRELQDENPTPLLFSSITSTPFPMVLLILTDPLSARLAVLLPLLPSELAAQITAHLDANDAAFSDDAEPAVSTVSHELLVKVVQACKGTGSSTSHAARDDDSLTLPPLPQAHPPSPPSSA